MKQLFVAWAAFQRRSVSLRDHFDFELEFISLSFKHRLLRPLEYILKSGSTLSLFIRRQPKVIWLQLPPTLLLYLSYFYQQVFNPKTIIIADCHNATFREPWIKLPYVVPLLNRCDLVLVHSEQVEKQAEHLGIHRELICFLEDPPPVIEAASEMSLEGSPDRYTHPWVLCPCSFNRDEPIAELLKAARLAPDITFVVTGKSSRAKGVHDLSDIPSNVKLPGFLPLEVFNNLLLKTDVVLGLTKLDGIQLSVAVEATGIGTPMVLSNTSLLRKLFYKGAVYVNSDDPTSIAQGCHQALLKHDTLAKQVCELKEERRSHWLEQTSRVKKLLVQAR
ncbi:MAG: hypothetical protein AAFW84_09505 [Cyanobacteria bacterium J06635_15]